MLSFLTVGWKNYTRSASQGSLQEEKGDGNLDGRAVSRNGGGNAPRVDHLRAQSLGGAPAHQFPLPEEMGPSPEAEVLMGELSVHNPDDETDVNAQPGENGGEADGDILELELDPVQETADSNTKNWSCSSSDDEETTTATPLRHRKTASGTMVQMPKSQPVEPFVEGKYPFLHQFLAERNISIPADRVVAKRESLEQTSVSDGDINAFYAKMLKEKKIPYDFPMTRAYWVVAESLLQRDATRQGIKRFGIPTASLFLSQFHFSRINDHQELLPAEIDALYKRELERRRILATGWSFGSEEAWQNTDLCLQYYEERVNLDRILAVEPELDSSGQSARSKAPQLTYKKGIDWRTANVLSPPKSAAAFLAKLESCPDAFKKIEALDLSGLNLSSVPRVLYSASFPRLKVLNISNNNLTFIPPDFFFNAPNLELVCLQRNLIRWVSDDFASSWNQWMAIDLSANLIGSFPPNFLTPLHDQQVFRNRGQAFEHTIRTFHLSANRLCRGSFSNKTWAILNSELLTAVELWGNGDFENEKVARHILIKDPSH